MCVPTMSPKLGENLGAGQGEDEMIALFQSLELVYKDMKTVSS